MKLRKAHGLLIGFLALFMSSLVIPAFGAETIKMGLVVPLTGSFADEGTEMVRGVELFIAEINAKGGLLGKKVEVIIGDVGEFSGEKIVSIGEKLVSRDKVDMIMTQYLGGVVDVKTYGEYEIPYLNMDTSSLLANTLRDNPDKYRNVFQTCPTEEFYGDGTFDFIDRIYPSVTRSKFPNQKIALVTQVRGYNDRISKRFKAIVKKSKWEIVVDEQTPAGTVEWGPVLAKIRQANPAVIYFNDHLPQDEVAFLEQFHNNPIKSLLFMQYGPSNPAFINLAKAKSNGIFWGTATAFFGPKYEEWKKTYEKKYKEKPGMGTAAGTYTSSLIWAEAVKKAGSEKNYKEVCRMLRENPYSFTGMLHVFHPETQTALSGEGLAPFAVYQIQNLTHQLISPARYSSAKMQIPAWMK